MKATIVNFRQGRHHQTDNQLIINVEGIESIEKAKSLVGKIAIWKSPAGKEIKGKVSGTHGNSGAVKAIFDQGMPGQCFGNPVDIQ